MIYLDNSATTFPDPLVMEEVCRCMATVWGNPSSRHRLGMEAEKQLTECRRRVARVMGVGADELYFTSGGTEGDNIAVMGGANIKKGKRVVTTAVEHPAVLECMKGLEEQGFEVVYLPPEGDGTVPLSAFREAITPQTCLVSVMAVNNEVGAIMPVDKIKSIMTRVCPRALLHVDAVQAFGHIPLHFAKWGVDMASVSSHKIHGPRGVGALYVRRGVTLKTPSLGGGQEKGLRSGTENIAGISGFTVAAELLTPNDGAKTAELKEELKGRLLAIPGAVHNGGSKEAPHILNVSFAGIRSEIMLNALNMREIYVSSASACASGKPSYVLRAMGVQKADSAIRFSLSRYNTMEEIEAAASAVREIVEQIR